MEKNKKYGFSHVRRRDLSELNCTLYEFLHEKSGARLIYLDREDDNKTFAIGFATPPENHTGVCHIIEHSVLCGSEKYPLNDPFAELLKGSLNTFLNAVTYTDRTVYPVSSRCEKDFLNLTDVYMDAVFAPNMLKNPSIFKQEGWRYEYDEETDTLSYNGVVYNEMKGVYSSPDELGAAQLSLSLFSGTPYEYDSGGKPSDITSLSYEQFKDFYRRHYHPSNAKIFLDGRMDLDKVLPLLDSHLSKFDLGEAVKIVCESKKQISPDVTLHYEISESDEEKGKARVLIGHVFSDVLDKESQTEASIISDLLCGSNASPLKKAFLDRGIAKDAAMYTIKGYENVLVIEVRDAEEDRLDEVDEVINQVLSELINDGIDKEKLHSTLNTIEFRIREGDHGALPTGIVYAMTVMEHWIFDDTPEESLLLNSTIEAVRTRIDQGKFEEIIKELIIDNPHKAKVIMLPDKTLAKRTEEEERATLEALLKSMSEEELSEIKEENEALKTWQSSPPTEEEEASLPTLSLEDIPEGSSRPFAKETEVLGVKTLLCPVKTNGIVYISMLFDVSDLANEEFINLALLSYALMNFPTEKRDALSLQNDIKANLGSLFATVTVGSRNGIATPYLKVTGKALTSKAPDLLRLTEELILSSKIDSEKEMARIIKQMRSGLEDVMLSSGESVALSRTEASRSELGAISEYLSGYEAYRILCELCKDDEKISEATKNVKALLEKIIDRKRLTVLVTGTDDEEFLESLVSLVPDKNIPYEKKHTPPCAEKNEYLLMPTKVCYAAKSGRCEEVGEHLGIMRVVRSILSYEYLWNTVRVQSGAYGTGFIPRKENSLSFYSYRDPSPARSLEFYDGSADYLRSLANEGANITKFIIGAIGEYDTLITPRVATRICESDYIVGWKRDDEIKVRHDMLNMTSEDLLVAAELIDKAMSDSSIAVVGGEEHLKTLKEKPAKILKI